MSAWLHLQTWWRTVSPREQRLLLAALALVTAALVWWVALAPALATLRTAAQQRPLLEARLQHMQRLQAQAKTLQAQPRPSAEEARRTLEASVKPLAPSVQMNVTGDRVTLTLKGLSADALAQWLAQARLNARMVPSEARLLRQDNGTWDGTLVLQLP